MGNLAGDPGKMTSNAVSWFKEKPLSITKQGIVYKPRFIFKSGYYSRAGCRSVFSTDAVLRCLLAPAVLKNRLLAPATFGSVMGKKETVIHGQTRYYL